MRRPSPALLTLLTAAAGLGAGAGVYYHFQHERLKLDQAHAATLQARREQWTNDEWNARLEVREQLHTAQGQLVQKADETLNRQRQALESALGDPVQLALKDPDLPAAGNDPPRRSCLRS